MYFYLLERQCSLLKTVLNLSRKKEYLSLLKDSFLDLYFYVLLNVVMLSDRFLDEELNVLNVFLCFLLLLSNEFSLLSLGRYCFHAIKRQYARINDVYAC